MVLMWYQRGTKGLQLFTLFFDWSWDKSQVSQSDNLFYFVSFAVSLSACMFSACLNGFSVAALVSSHRLKTCRSGESNSKSPVGVNVSGNVFVCLSVRIGPCDRLETSPAAFPHLSPNACWDRLRPPTTMTKISGFGPREGVSHLWYLQMPRLQWVHQTQMSCQD